MLDIYWLLCVCIRTIQRSDSTGSLFAFTPEFYLNVAINAYSALKNYFSPAHCMDQLPGGAFDRHTHTRSSSSVYMCEFLCVCLRAGYEETLTNLAAILAKHFADPRIVGTGKGAFSTIPLSVSPARYSSLSLLFH